MVMPQLWGVIEMRCNESTVYIYPQFKRQYFLQTIENSNLLTNFTRDFTNLSLKLKLVIDRDAKELKFVLTRDNGSFTGQHTWFLFMDWIHRLNFFQRSLIQAFSFFLFLFFSQSSYENLWDLLFVEWQSGYRWTCFLQIHPAVVISFSLVKIFSVRFLLPWQIKFCSLIAVSAFHVLVLEIAF